MDVSQFFFPLLILYQSGQTHIWYYIIYFGTFHFGSLSILFTVSIGHHVRSGPEVRKIFKIRNVRKPDVFLPGCRIFKTKKKIIFFFSNFNFQFGEFQWKWWGFKERFINIIFFAEFSGSVAASATSQLPPPRLFLGAQGGTSHPNTQNVAGLCPVAPHRESPARTPHFRGHSRGANLS